MNLQPLYDVKDRLEHAAIAGTGLLGEDFRLQRAAEGLKPLTSASPVFAKIDAALSKLLSAPAEERAGALLDTLALVDAVAYTQARTGAEGELESLNAGVGSCRQLSYAQLHPLLEALTGTGGGRMNQIKDTWENHPEFFTDFRVLPALVDGLGESYAELADLELDILQAQGPGIIPLLKKNFDPAGKKDMARRVQLIDALAGAAENDWYLDQLPAAKKQVRESLLLALRHTPENGELLAALCETEKRDCQAAARWALARSDTPQARDYWRVFAQKNPNEMLRYMQLSTTPTSAGLVSELCQREMAFFRKNPNAPLDHDVWTRLSSLRFAMEHKTGPQILDAFRAAAALGSALDREVEVERNGKLKKEPMKFWCFGATSQPDAQRYFSCALPVTLLRSIQYTRDPGLCALADELFEQYGGPWAAPAVVAALLTQNSADAYCRAEEILHPKFRLFTGKKHVDTQVVLRDATWALLWNEQTGRHEYLVYVTDPATADRTSRSRSLRPALAEPLDPRWYDLLMDEGGQDAALMNVLRPMDGPVMERLGKYFYFKATHWREARTYADYVRALIRCGWTDWDRFWVQCCLYQGEVNYYSVQSVLDQLPISGKEKAAQLREVTDLIWSKKLKAKSGMWPDAQIKRMIAQWESEGN